MKKENSKHRERKESNAKGGKKKKKHAIKEQSKEDKINCKKERMKTEGEEQK